MSDLKIEAGKFYKCRDNVKARCIGFADDGRVVIERTENVVVLRSGGTSFRDSTHEYDLIAEWREPRTWERIVYVVQYDDGDVQVYMRWCDEDKPLGKIIARRKITLTEGEGCDGK